MRQPVSLEVLSKCDLEEPIKGSTCVDCDDFEAPYLEAAKARDESGEHDQALVYRLLACLCSFHFKPGDKVEPFSNRIAFADGSRTLIGSDFSDNEVDAIRPIVPNIQNAALKTRLADFVWSRRKSSADCARIAIDGYVELVRKLIDGTGKERFSEADVTGIAAEEFLKRAIVIARSTGWSRNENDKLRKTLSEVLVIASASNDLAVVRFGELALSVNLDGAQTVFEKLSERVTALVGTETFAAEGIQKLIARIARRDGDDGTIKEAHLNLAAIYEARADKASHAMLKTHALQEAIDSLQGIQGVKQERQRLFDKLKDAQLHMVDEFGKIEHSVDLSDEVDRILAFYGKLDLLECLKALASSELPKRPDDLIKHAQEEAQRFPLSGLFSTSLVDAKGRTIARTGGGGVGNESTLRHKIIQQEYIRIGIGIGANILPVRQFITQKFDVHYGFILEICSISPFVPSGLEHAFARGIQAFL